jgi:hypothetical protein
MTLARQLVLHVSSIIDPPSIQFEEHPHIHTYGGGQPFMLK